MEVDVVQLLDFYRADAEALYLAGDVFEHYVEYRHAVPKGFVRFQAALARWTDAGKPVTYVVGNHDPWHRDYFERELGVRVEMDQVEAEHAGYRVHVRHGDGLASISRLYNRIKPILRHPTPVWLYKTLLPADLGIGLARWYARRFGHDELHQSCADDLRAYARHIVETTPADLVVMGHSHMPELTQWPAGTYLNAGHWHADRTFGLLTPNGPELYQWSPREAKPRPLPGPVHREASTSVQPEARN